MAREVHLSVRLSREEREALDRAASALDLTVGQVVRRAIRTLVAEAAPPQRPPVDRRQARGRVDRRREMRWLEEHASELSTLAGEWLVIEGDALIAHGPDYLAVLAEARQQGVDVPFVEHVPQHVAPGYCMGV